MSKHLWHPLLPVPKRFLGRDVTLSSVMGQGGSGHKGHTGFEPHTPLPKSETPPPISESHILKELLCHDAGPGIDREFHLTDFLVNLLHEMDDKVHQLVLVHLLRVEVCDQEADVIALPKREAP